MQFSLQKILRELPSEAKFTKKDLQENFEQIYRDVRLIFGGIEHNKETDFFEVL